MGGPYRLYYVLTAPWADDPARPYTLKIEDTKTERRIPVAAIARALETPKDDVWDTATAKGIWKSWSCTSSGYVLLSDLPVLLAEFGWTQEQIAQGVAQLTPERGLKHDPQARARTQKRPKPDSAVVHDTGDASGVVEDDEDDDREEDYVPETAVAALAMAKRVRVVNNPRDWLDAFLSDCRPYAGETGYLAYLLTDDYKERCEAAVHEKVQAGRETLKQKLRARLEPTVRAALKQEVEEDPNAKERITNRASVVAIMGQASHFVTPQ